MPRPSMRTPSLTMRVRTTCFCSERNAFLISPARPANAPGASSEPTSVAMTPDSSSSSRSLRALLSAIVIASRRLVADRVGDRVEGVGLVVDPRLVLDELDRAVGLLDLGDELELEVDRRR